MEENKNLDNNQINNENGNPANPDQDNKKPGFIKTNAKRVGGVAKKAAPVLAKVAVVGGAAAAATLTVLHKIGDSASEILEHVDSVKDAIAEKGGDVVESIKDSLEG